MLNKRDKQAKLKETLDRLTADLWGQRDVSKGYGIVKTINRLCYKFKGLYPELISIYQKELRDYRAHILNLMHDE